MSTRPPIPPWVRNTDDFPRKATLGDYESAIGEYVQPLASRSEIAAIYQFGSVGDPGISDIDLIVVLEDDVQSFPADLLGLERLPANERYLFMHRPFVMCRSACPGVRLFYDVHTLSLRRGADSAQSLMGASVLEGLSPADVRTAMLVDFGLELLHQFIHTQVTGRMNVRPLLCLLLSARTSISMAEGLGLLAAERAMTFTERVRFLRAEALTRDPLELTGEVAELVESAADLLNTALFRAAERLAFDGSGGILEFAPKDLVVFTSRVSADHALELSLRDSYDTDRRWSWRRLRNRMILFQHAGLMAHYGCYAEGGGAVGRAIAARLLGGGRAAGVPRSYAEVLSAKLRFANLQADFLSRVGLSFGQMFLYTLGRSSPPGERSWMSEVIEGRTRRAFLSYAE